jgi:hypothetical protein
MFMLYKLINYIIKFMISITKYSVKYLMMQKQWFTGAATAAVVDNSVHNSRNNKSQLY